MIGDDFLRDLFPTLQEIKVEGRSKAMPYMYDYFNITSCMAHPQSEVKSIIARVQNSLVKALNESNKLPRIILFIIDWDILENIDYATTVKSQLIGSTLEWLISNVDKAIQAKKDGIRQIRPGALGINEPKIIWSKMLMRPEFSPELELAQGIANVIMEDLLAAKKGHFITDLTHELCDQIYYQRNDDLNGHGRVKFWRALDQIIQSFDQYEISLRPISTKEKELRKKKQQQEEQMKKSNRRGQAIRCRGSRARAARGRYFYKNITY